MVPPPDDTVVALDARARARARRQLAALLAEARLELDAAEDGDIGGVYATHRLLGRAVAILLEYRLDAA